MLAVSVELLHGTFRGDPDGTAGTGRLRRGEWPPSPARLFAALIAADGTGDASRVTDGTELGWLERLPPPAIYADDRPSHNLLEPRYVVEHGRAATTHQEYPARTGALSRSGVRVAPRFPRVVYWWAEHEPEDAVLEALRRRAARVGYLGASDSPVRLRVTVGSLPAVGAAGAYLPDAGGDLVVNVVRPGDTGRWDRMHEQWRERGASVRRAQFPALAHARLYRSPSAPGGPDRGGVAAWLRLTPAIPGRRVGVVTARFKQAVLSQHQRIHGDPPPVLHGHGMRGQGYDIARYLALPDVGYARSRGHIHGLALWLPAGSGGAMRAMARDAARSIARLSGPGVDALVSPHDGEERPRAGHPDRWRGPSREWVTAIPAIHERRGRLDLEEVARWCEHAALPRPLSFRSGRTPLIPGGIDLAPAEVNRPGRPGLPYSHVAIRFEDEVEGPVVVGSGRQRGFGLCVPPVRQG